MSIVVNCSKYEMNQSYFSPILNPALESPYLQSFHPPFQPTSYNNGAHHPHLGQNASLRSRTIYDDCINSQRTPDAYVNNQEPYKHHPAIAATSRHGMNKLSIDGGKTGLPPLVTAQITEAKNQTNSSHIAVELNDNLDESVGCVVAENKRKVRKIGDEYKPAETITHDEHQESIRNSPSYYLGLFLDLDVVNWLIGETVENGRALKKFLSPTKEEMRCFIAILYLSGYVDVPRRRMLWERSPDTHCPLVSNAMQRDRFESIFTALHTGDNVNDAERLGKIIPLLDMLNMRYLQNMPVDEQHCVGQVGAPLSLKHHNAKGPGKCLRVWCGCTKNGYCAYITPTQFNEAGLGGSVILQYAHLVRRYNPSLCSLVFDSSYSDVGVVGQLQKMGVQAVAADREKTSCPLNPSLGGVDRLESNLNLYRTSFKARKSYSALLTFCLDVALSNAWHVYRSVARNKKPLDLLGFRRSVVVYYLEHYAKPIAGRKGGRPLRAKPKGKRHPPSDARFDGIRHYVVPQEKQTRCAKCTAKTTTRCQKCDVGVHVKCFVEFHTRPKEDSK